MGVSAAERLDAHSVAIRELREAVRSDADVARRLDRLEDAVIDLAIVLRVPGAQRHEVKAAAGRLAEMRDQITAERSPNEQEPT
jgi:hypothetical protein